MRELGWANRLASSIKQLHQQRDCCIYWEDLGIDCNRLCEQTSLWKYSHQGLGQLTSPGWKSPHAPPPRLSPYERQVSRQFVETPMKEFRIFRRRELFKLRTLHFSRFWRVIVDKFPSRFLHLSVKKKINLKRSRKGQKIPGNAKKSHHRF